MDLSIVIPMHNEQANIDELARSLARLRDRLDVKYEIVVVDDASDDATPAMLAAWAARDERVRVVRLAKNGGMGAALIEGTRAARAPHVVWSMADLSDRVDDIPRLFAKLRDGYDLVIASRAMPGGSYGDLGRGKSALSHAYSFVTRLLFGIPAHDITNAFRGVRRELIDRVRLVSRDFAISPELAIRARQAGARIAEIPTTYRYRTRGDSHFRIPRMGYRYALLWRLAGQAGSFDAPRTRSLTVAAPTTHDTLR